MKKNAKTCLPYGKLAELPLDCLKPEGWLKAYLEKQVRGLTGHINRSGYPFSTLGWATKGAVRIKRGGGWWPYEQTGYWVDGAVRCAHLLRDKALLKEALRPINAVLERADDDGYLGPAFMKVSQEIKRWPHAVFFRALVAHHSVTGDPRIPKALERHYLSGTSDHHRHREACNIEPILWTYEQTGNPALLEHAIYAFEHSDEFFSQMGLTVEQLLSDAPGNTHGVGFCEMAKLGAILYRATGNKRWLKASVHGFEKLDRDSMLIDGVPSSSEHLRDRDPLESHETCVTADYTWSAGHLLLSTGEAAWADRIERACFNAAQGAVSADFRSHQYFSCPNQVICDATSNHNGYRRGDRWMMFSAGQHTQCCTGNVHRIMPNYAARMWLRDRRGGLVAALHGPGRVTARVGAQQRPVTIEASTSYPFSDRIDYVVKGRHAVRFPLVLRIPGWCEGARVTINGRESAQRPAAGTWLTLDRLFKPGDRIQLILPMRLRLSHWPDGGVGIERGPLVFALRIKEQWTEVPAARIQKDAWPAWSVTAASPWNYALDLGDKDLDKVEVIQQKWQGDGYDLEHPPLLLRVPARKVAGWEIQQVERYRRAKSGETAARQWSWIDAKASFTPPLPKPAALRRGLSHQVETITLVPYGCTHLRISIFPSAAPARRKV